MTTCPCAVGYVGINQTYPYSKAALSLKTAVIAVL